MISPRLVAVVVLAVMTLVTAAYLPALYRLTQRGQLPLALTAMWAAHVGLTATTATMLALHAPWWVPMLSGWTTIAVGVAAAAWIGLRRARRPPVPAPTEPTAGKDH